MTTPENKYQPLLITILAGAISSVGYGVSILAVGIIWLLPSVKPVAPALLRPQRKPKHRRRRSAPPVLQSSLQRPPLSTPVSNSSQSSTNNARTPFRRVYFADSPTLQTTPPLPLRRHTSPSENLHKDCKSLKDSTGATNNADVDVSPRSSSSTLVHAPPPPTPPRISISVSDATPKSEFSESDTSRLSSSTSSRPSLLTSTRFPHKFKASWSRKPKPPGNNHLTDSGGEAHSDEPSYSAGPSTPVCRHKRKAASLGFSWPISKNKAVAEATSALPPSPKTPIDTPLMPDCHVTPSISSFVRSNKQQRRASAPVRARTQPYAYPYFALPPTMAREQPAVGVNPVVASQDNGLLDREGVSSVRESTSDQRLQNTAERASLGLGHTRTLPQKRATSEGFALTS